MILLDDKVVCPTSFPDGTLALRVDVSSKNNQKVIEWNYESDTEMVVLYYITKHLKSAGFSVSLFMPYIPNARMDRVKNGDEIFTLKYFAEFINSLGFETVYVRDPHSNVSCALFDNLKVDDGFKYLVVGNATYGRLCLGRNLDKVEFHLVSKAYRLLDGQYEVRLNVFAYHTHLGCCDFVVDAMRVLLHGTASTCIALLIVVLVIPLHLWARSEWKLSCQIG